MSSVKTSINIRIPINIKKKIMDNFCSKNYTLSDFIRDAAYEKLEKESSMIDVLSKSISESSENINRLYKELDLFMKYFDSFLYGFFIYNPALPDNNEKREGARKSATSRYENFRKSFVKSISKNNGRFMLDLFGDVSDL